ncbi:MAG: hypothetical protein GC168_06110 [Candidatus Hydrogenedens sp.]|nr:hypothetical protein [Candidatus Hydrogenedens sp.]
MPTRRAFLAGSLGAAALAAVPGMAAAQPAEALGAWLGVQDIGPVYYVHARAAGACAQPWRAAIFEALGRRTMHAELCYGERGGETLYTTVMDNGTKMDLTERPEADEAVIEITFRGAKGTAVFHA